MKEKQRNALIVVSITIFIFVVAVNFASRKKDAGVIKTVQTPAEETLQDEADEFLKGSVQDNLSLKSEVSSDPSELQLFSLADIEELGDDAVSDVEELVEDLAANLIDPNDVFEKEDLEEAFLGQKVEIPISVLVEDFPEINEVIFQNENLELCGDSDLNILFLCDPEWVMQPADDAVLVVISSEPLVTLIIAKIKSDIKFLGQLTNMKLREMKQYKKGFQTENVNIADIRAIKVKAFSKDNEDKRVLDYYFMYDQSLYGLMFSVSPKQNWEKYKYLVKSIADSIQM